MNVKLLREVAKHILEEPRRLLMRAWIFEKTTPSSKVFYSRGRNHRPFARCGTAACISGWACILAGKKEEAQKDSFLSVGAQVLGLNSDEANRLFGPGCWPDKFEGGLRDDGKAKTAKIAVARIEHFIETEGRE